MAKSKDVVVPTDCQASLVLCIAKEPKLILRTGCRRFIHTCEYYLPTTLRRIEKGGDPIDYIVLSYKVSHSQFIFQVSTSL